MKLKFYNIQAHIADISLPQYGASRTAPHIPPLSIYNNTGGHRQAKYVMFDKSVEKLLVHYHSGMIAEAAYCHFQQRKNLTFVGSVSWDSDFYITKSKYSIAQRHSAEVHSSAPPEDYFEY